MILPDLSAPKTFDDQDLGDLWRELRRSAPVVWHGPVGDRPGFWVVSRHSDIVDVYRDSGTYSSQFGNVLTTLLTGGDSAAGIMLPVTDGSRHRQLRNIILRALSPRTLDRILASLRDRTERLLEAAIERGTCDFAADIASRIPMGTIADLLGVPPEDEAFLLSQTRSALSSDERDSRPEEAVEARHEILLYFGELLDLRRKSPDHGAISELAEAEIDGAKLTDDEIVLNCYSLIVGGDETSRLTMIDAVNALAGHPEQWHLLRTGAVDLPTAGEELLRWASPTMHFGRTAQADSEIAGVPIAEGDIVTLWHSSANRDETVFPSPDELMLARTPNRHLAFGYGPHFCLGATLARMEVTELLRALRAKVAELDVAGPPKRIHSNFLTGFSSLPVRFGRHRTDAADGNGDARVS